VLPVLPAANTPTNLAQPAFLEWAERGFAHELVLVAPHDSPGSAPGKRPLEIGWQAKVVTMEDLQRWSRAPSNVGLRARPFPAIDIDVDDPLLADAVQRVAFELLGATPRRVRANAARRLLPYRLDGEPFAKAVLSFTLPEGRAAKVEILADGQQYVVAGTHASGAALEWEPAEPVASELPTMSVEQRGELLRCLRVELERAGCVLRSPALATTLAPVSPPSTADLARSARRANGYAATMPAAISGQGGHSTALDALSRISEVSLTDAIFDAAAEAYNARCQPPWSGAEWEHKKSEAQRLHPLGEKFDATPTVADREDEVPDEQRFTDLGNARRFASAARGTFLYVHAWKAWMNYDGRRWVRDGAKATHELAAKVARGLFGLTAAAKSLEDQKAIADHALRSQRRDKVEAMVALASSVLPDLKTEPSGFDASADLLNVMNGTLDLRTGELRPHDPDDLITKLVPVTYDPDATAPTWERFLGDVLPDPETRAFLQRAAGYSATGHVREHALFFLYGKGRNGKGTFTRALASVLGDYVDVAPPGILLASQNERHPTDIVDLIGKRLVSAAETGENNAWNEERVKWLTGGDALKGRAMRENWRASFEPTHKFWVESNHEPRVRGVDEGIWSRIRKVPFKHQWREPGDDAPERAHLPIQDLGLREKLLAERPGILAWVVRGAREWYADGLGTPREVREATAAYRAEQDLVGEFLTTVRVGGRLLKDVHAEYAAFAAANDEPPVSSRAISGELKRRGYDVKPTRNGRVVLPVARESTGAV
jgi:P4 family phage/plasmid primase-like protien